MLKELKQARRSDGKTLHLINRGTPHHSFVVCWNFDGEEWDLGYYCDTMALAEEIFSDKVEEFGFHIIGVMLDRNSDHIRIENRAGTWYVIDQLNSKLHGKIFLLESEVYGDEAACLIVGEKGELILGDVHNGFHDYEEYLLARKIEQ